jgi:pimeloyl-ACP methyl ester carboxylesterase
MGMPLSLLSQPRSGEGPAVNYGRNDEIEKYIHVRGFEMHYEVYGHGQPLLLIHGNGGSIVSMANQIPFFSKSYQVIAADSRSQGKSFDAQDSLSYEMMADDYNALMDSLHLDSAYIVGWSDGGIIGLLMAIRHPEKVKKLAVTGANIRPDTTAVSAADIRYMKENLLSLRDQKQDAKTRNEIKLTQLMIDEPNISFKSLQRIHCPVLVICGDHDIIKTEHTLEIYRSIPGASLWILPGSGHDTCIRFKDDFNTQVYRFFNN